MRLITDGWIETGTTKLLRYANFARPSVIVLDHAASQTELTLEAVLRVTSRRRWSRLLLTYTPQVRSVRGNSWQPCIRR
ncbi:MAG TPA: hypothetical protein VNE63_22580 [Candidatus Acidoferrales bacterium]|nr:hypothetical protein [Candidatus Acidoferrales bacterium]